jgi:hypothetical protein
MRSHNSDADGVIRLRSGYLLPLKYDRSGARLERARYDTQQRRLAGPIRSDEAEQPSSLHFEAHILHGSEPGKILGEPIEFKYGRQRRSSLSRSGSID